MHTKRRTKNEERRTVSGLRPLFYCPRSTAHSLRPASAFTLVEIMVVVAVIALLLMLLIPNIRTVREKAWSSNCQNNLRQYGIAMNQYMADYSGFFIYPGAGNLSAGATYDASMLGYQGTYGNRVSRSGGEVGSLAQSWFDMTAAYLPTGVTIQSLSAGEPSVRVCPMILQQIRKEGNFFDPDSQNFKGLRDSTDWAGSEVQLADGELLERHSAGSGYDENDKLILDVAFTTYAINHWHIGRNKKNIPESVVAFIDWNARDGWWATLSYTNWMFNGTNSQGQPVVQDTQKRADGAWWLTEVGFHHLQGGIYGANYVAMDGHVGWIGSNAISVTNFTTGL